MGNTQIEDLKKQREQLKNSRKLLPSNVKFQSTNILPMYKTDSTQISTNQMTQSNQKEPEIIIQQEEYIINDFNKKQESIQSCLEFIHFISLVDSVNNTNLTLLELSSFNFNDFTQCLTMNRKLRSLQNKERLQLKKFNFSVQGGRQNDRNIKNINNDSNAEYYSATFDASQKKQNEFWYMNESFGSNSQKPKQQQKGKIEDFTDNEEVNQSFISNQSSQGGLNFKKRHDYFKKHLKINHQSDSSDNEEYQNNQKKYNQLLNSSNQDSQKVILLGKLKKPKQKQKQSSTKSKLTLETEQQSQTTIKSLDINSILPYEETPGFATLAYNSNQGIQNNSTFQNNKQNINNNDIQQGPLIKNNKNLENEEYNKVTLNEKFQKQSNIQLNQNDDSLNVFHSLQKDINNLKEKMQSKIQLTPDKYNAYQNIIKNQNLSNEVSFDQDWDKNNDAPQQVFIKLPINRQQITQNEQEPKIINLNLKQLKSISKPI